MEHNLTFLQIKQGAEMVLLSNQQIKIIIGIKIWPTCAGVISAAQILKETIV